VSLRIVPEEPGEAPEENHHGIGEEFSPPGQPMTVARELLPDWQDSDGRLVLRHWRGTWMRWQSTHWAEVDLKHVRSALYRRLEDATYVVENSKGAAELKQWAPNRRKIGDLMEAVAAHLHLPDEVDPPCWTAMERDAATSLRAREQAGPIVACTNGLLDVPTRELADLTPEFFNLVSVPFDYDPHAPQPAAWLEFLHQLWPDDADAEQIRTLQEYMGYVLSGRLDLHKLLLIVGPTRSGKGTIARVLKELIGAANVAGPTLASLCSDFGISPLLGKPLAVISDARMAGADKQVIVERLLTITGEDSIDVNRKFKDPWTGRLPTRFLVLSNELPHFGDSSGVIANRFVVLTMTRSWLGAEDYGLIKKLLAELPGILNWALAGLDRLTEQGRLTEPAVSRESVTSMQDTASPTSAFVRERCIVGAGTEVHVEDLWAEWKSWCDDNGRDKPGTKQMFARNLRSVAPGIRTVQPRDGDKRYRMYHGIRLALNEPHNDPGRVPPRANGDETGSARGGTRPTPLWAQHETDPDCPDCARLAYTGAPCWQHREAAP
jgi:putative DNA primase/helicase